MFSIEYLRSLRLAEVDSIVAYLPPGGRILELGAGTGEQAAELSRRGFQVTAIDLNSSNYSDHRMFDVIDYDGVNIPAPNDSFDAVFSSNVMEHVVDIDDLEQDIRRVLRPDGVCVHLVPTPAWRIWSGATAFISTAQAGVNFFAVLLGRSMGTGSYRGDIWRAFRRTGGQFLEAILQPRHGERGGRLSELYYFSRGWWTRHFIRSGFTVQKAGPAGLFYTGFMVCGPRLSFDTRRSLARRLGSACHLFVLSNKQNDLAPGQMKETP